MGLDFAEYAPGDAPLQVPANYLPVALPYLQNRELLTQRVLVSPEITAPLWRVPRNAFLDPRNFEGQMREIGQELPDDFDTRLGRSFVGPEFADIAAREVFDKKTPPTGDPWATVPYIVVIDSGIAFWNEAFRVSGTKFRFKGMGYLNFVSGEPQFPAIEVLNAGEIAEICGLADTVGGNRAVVRGLAGKFSESVYNHGLGPTGFSHGTAMASLAAEGNDALMVGMELPASVLRDPTGGTLQAALPHALNGALELVWDYHKKTFDDDLQPRVHAVVSFGFTGGPGDGSHPANGFLSGVLEQWKRLLSCQLFLPMGNQLQDRLHARVAAPAQEASAPLGWQIPQGDGSANTVEFHWATDTVPELHLTAPDGASASVPLRPGRIYQLKQDENTVGALWIKQGAGARPSAVLSLAPTRPGPGTPWQHRAQAGTWTLQFTEEQGGAEVDLWIQRDDQPVLPGTVPPFRQSRFLDDAYRRKDRQGRWRMDDDGAPASQVRRLGSASVLATSKDRKVTPVAAYEKLGPSGNRRAWYSSRFSPGGGNALGMTVDQGRPNKGTLCLGNGTARRFRISGTSAAAALALAHSLRH